MKRLLSSLALLLTLAGAAFGQTAVLPRPELRGNNVMFGGVLDLGPRVGNKLDLSGMYATAPNGGVARTLAEMLSNEVYAANYGVVANDGIDDSVAARRALKAAMDQRGTVVWPAGNIGLCTDPNDAEALLRIDRFVNMRGTRTTQFNPCPEAGTRATILIKPPASTPIRGAFIKDLIVVPAGGDAIRVETPNKGGVVAKLLVENVGTGMPQQGSYAFRHINSYTPASQGVPEAGNVTGGLFGATFRDSDFIGGMRFDLTGDSNNIERNVINGPNEGIYYKAIGGAATARTLGVWQQLTLLNGWTPGSNTNFRQGLWWMPLTDGTIRLSGTIMGGTVTAGTPIATIPEAFRPTGRVLRFMGIVNTNIGTNGTTWSTGVYQVDGAGNINIQALPTLAASGSFLTFDGSNFSVRP